MVSDFNKKRNREFPIKRFWFQAGGILFAIAIFALLAADFKMYQKKQGLASKIDSYQKQIEDIKTNSQDLKDKIANADNPDYLEKIAYEQGMVKTGEKEIVFILPAEQNSKTAEKPKNFWTASVSWFSNIWGWIKSKF